MSTNNRSSNTSDSCISNGNRSRLSCLAFPLLFGMAELDPTREFSGAFTKDASAMNEGSSLPTCLLSLRGVINRFVTDLCLC
jgi:hypothetical protein